MRSPVRWCDDLIDRQARRLVKSRRRRQVIFWVIALIVCEGFNYGISLLLTSSDQFDPSVGPAIHVPTWDMFALMSVIFVIYMMFPIISAFVRSFVRSFVRNMRNR